jgi:methylmalonyl-CoA/ethylmalonyl-CoA epimerase
MFGPVHHAGYIVTAIEPAEREFTALGYERLLQPKDDPEYQAEIVFLRRKDAARGEPLIELIRPISPQSAVYAHTKESKLQIHHLCFTVDDMAAAVLAAQSARMLRVGQVRPAPAIGGSAICFFFSRAIGLFELVERPAFSSASIPASAEAVRGVSL